MSSTINISRKALREAKEILGGYAEMARLCGVTRQAVNSWYENGIPITRAMQIEMFTKEKLEEIDINKLDPRKRNVIINLDAWEDGMVTQKRLYPEIRPRKSSKKEKNTNKDK